MTRPNQFLQCIILTSIASLLNVGCDNSAPPQSTSEISVVHSDDSSFLHGAGVKGPLAFAEVSVYTLDTQLPAFYDPNRPIASTTTTVTAHYADLTLPVGVHYPLILVIDGQGATDLNTGMQPVITTLVNIITEDMATANQGIYATPLTTLAFRLARRMPEARANPASFIVAMERAAETVKYELGFAMAAEINILTDPPILTDETTSINQQQQIIEHRAAIEIVASLADLIGRNSDDEASADSILERFSADLAYDDVLDNVSNEGSLGYGDWLYILSEPNNLIIPNTQIRIGDIENLIALESKLTGTNTTLDSEEVNLNLLGKNQVDDLVTSTSSTSTSTTTTTTTRIFATTTTTNARTTTTTARATTTTTKATTTTTKRTTTTTKATTTTTKATTTTTRTTTTTTRGTVTTTTTTTLLPKLTKGDPDNDPITWSNLVTDATGSIYWVGSAAEFNSRASAARPGDVIIVRNGQYSGWNLTIPSRGNENARIIYTAETRRGVTLSGTSRIRVTGSFNVIGGFIFNSLTSSNAITFDRAADNRFSDNQFLDCGSDNPEDRTIMIRNYSDRNRFDHNTMLRNKSFGMAIILPDDRDSSFGYSHDNRFDHNIFKDIQTSPNGYGRIPLQFGQTVNHTVDESRTLIDHNSFINLGQSAVNSKSTNETYLDNYFKDIIDNAGISMRAGDKKRAERNYFENVLRPIKINGENHVIANNIFINSLDFAVAVPSWGTFVGDNGATTKYEPTGYVLITHNTIINTGSNSIEVGRRWGSASTTSNTPPYNVTVSNNIVIGSEGTLLRVISSTNGVIEHNVLHATATAKVGTPGNSPYLIDPRLGSDHRPPANSVAVNCAISTTNIGTTDYYDRYRSKTADCGAVMH